ncbi:hypothetical protein BSLG_001990 [Batrachochytrium salamandrivorans]|nr:hypothetical protein BSLG_001990 [Batrachochytrium salamandrivorans]
MQQAFGAFNGKLAKFTANELGGMASSAAVKCLPAGTKIDSVIYGNVLQTSADAAYLARHVGHRAGLSIDASALTVNRLCGSGFQSIINGAQDILLGEAGVVLTPMGITAENLGKQFGITRKDADEYALLSQSRWAVAQQTGRFTNEIAPIEIKSRKGTETFDVDEHPRPKTTIEGLANLPSVFIKDTGIVTAGNASGISDGAASLIIASEESVKNFGLTSRQDCIGPVPAIKGALKRAGLSLTDMSLIEINEAFAAQVLAVCKDLSLDPSKVNVDGGAIALGHPLGASGARITAHLLHSWNQLHVPASVSSTVIGVDYGTDWLKMAMVKPGGVLETVLNGESKRKTAAVVNIRNGVRTYGSEAVGLVGPI